MLVSMLVAAGCSSSSGSAKSTAANGATTTAALAAGSLSKINHWVVLYEENWSFDSLYAGFPGADTAQKPSSPFAPQVDKAGTVYATLPPVIDTSKRPAPGESPTVDPRFPSTLANKPFDLSQYIPESQPVDDLVHRYYQEQAQIDGGKMDKFAAVSDAAGETMGYYDTASLPLAQEAQKYTLSDRFFHAAFGGSFLNHQWLVCACTPTFPGAPEADKAQLDPSGGLMADGFVTPDGHVVNTAYTANTPHPATAKPADLVPSLTDPTIGDRLSDKGVSWAWYSGGWNDAVAGNADKLFQYHHQPFAYYAKYADGTPGRAEHLKDETDFMAAAKAGTLPAVSFVKPIGANNEHPGYANLVAGETHALDVINAVRNGPNWKDTAIVITYDENGGFWDHVAPPKGDIWGPGARVPTIVIADSAKKGFVDHTTYDTTSILSTLEHRFGVAPLGDRDAKAADLSNAFVT